MRTAKTCSMPFVVEYFLLFLFVCFTLEFECSVAFTKNLFLSLSLLFLFILDASLDSYLAPTYLFHTHGHLSHQRRVLIDYHLRPLFSLFPSLCSLSFLPLRFPASPDLGLTGEGFLRDWS